MKICFGVKTPIELTARLSGSHLRVMRRPSHHLRNLMCIVFWMSEHDRDVHAASREGLLIILVYASRGHRPPLTSSRSTLHTGRRLRSVLDLNFTLAMGLVNVQGKRLSTCRLLSLSV